MDQKGPDAKETKINPKNRKKKIIHSFPESVSDMIRFPPSRTAPEGWRVGTVHAPYDGEEI